MSVSYNVYPSDKQKGLKEAFGIKICAKRVKGAKFDISLTTGRMKTADPSLLLSNPGFSFWYLLVPSGAL